ncbi:hypothetical protein AAV94_09550 [Lampropedia cohaerens]|uniref:diguanylate cyclase n=1 Tax=Lampropedia cohaerens TaxID=1610491 RepID=A0A0U1PYP2_9BURK|nr:diguanylate cyclase [Lampropedia cohaerens]KKW67638.1 hypothetical protein AAV94_09550 [Lampropedia cohaerens]
MNRQAENGQSRPVRLKRLLRVTQLRAALLIVAVTSICMMAAGVWTIARYANQNLHLVGRTLVYNLEAPLVFGDAVAIKEVIDEVARAEHLASVWVLDENNALVGRYQDGSRGAAVAEALGDLLMQQPLELPVLHDGTRIGTVRLSVQSVMLAQFLMFGLLLFLAAVVLSALVSSQVSRRVQRRLMQPIDELARAARHISRERAFHLRVPGSPIVELNDLAGDINVLVGEVQQWQGHVEKEKQQLAYRADHDALTGLGNLRQFELAMAEAMRSAASVAGGFALLFIDCDNFKAINDRFGHAAGDRVLVEIARRLRKSARASDRVMRMGGDEFAVIMQNVYAPERALRAAIAVRQRIAGDVLVEDEEAGARVRPSVSIGVALFPQHGRGIAELKKAADRAMYEAKQSQFGARVRLARP